MMTATFWKAAAERAVKTAAQALLLAIGAAKGFDLFHLDWVNALGAAAGGALLSILTSIASSPFGTPGVPSLVKIPGSTAAPAPQTGDASTYNV